MMSMLLRSKRQRMAPTVPAMVPLLKQTETKKKKERVKKTLTKRPKEKREKKRKMVRERRKRKAMTKFCFLSPNLVISYYIYQIRHLIIISALEKRGKKRSTASVRKKKRILSSPFKNPDKNKKIPLQIERKTLCIILCSCEFVLVIYNQRQKKTNIRR